MKRIQAACICQTVHFLLKEDISHDLAVRQVQEDAARLDMKRDADRALKERNA